MYSKGKTKNVGNPYDDEFEQMSDMTSQPSDGSGDMRMYESYQEFNVDEKAVHLRTSCKAMILSLCKIYLDTLEISNEDYVKAVALVEEQNLFVLMKQVQYADHVLDSLMRQLDSGGYIDKGIYSTIREMQKSAIQITLEISKYTRNLPEYFKFVARDAKSADTSLDILSASTSARTQNIIDITGESVSGEFNPMVPQRGMRELMLNVSDVRKDIADAIKNAATVNATPINPEDLDEWNEKLEDDLDEDE